mgnify:CR=1 FL=1
MYSKLSEFEQHDRGILWPLNKTAVETFCGHPGPLSFIVEEAPSDERLTPKFFFSRRFEMNEKMSKGAPFSFYLKREKGDFALYRMPEQTVKTVCPNVLYSKTLPF